MTDTMKALMNHRRALCLEWAVESHTEVLAARKAHVLRICHFSSSRDWRSEVLLASRGLGTPIQGFGV